MSNKHDTTNTERSAIFSEYNRLRGRGNVERGRLNRALGLAQTGRKRPYDTTIHACDCPDSINNPGVVCKHRAALRMRQKAAARPYDLDETNDLLFG